MLVRSLTDVSIRVLFWSISVKQLTKIACSGHDLPLEACLANPSLLTKPSCAGNKYSLDVCLATPQLLSQPSCVDNFSGSACAQNPSITLLPSCSGALADYTPSLPECMGNKKALCSLNKCGNFDLWKC